MQADENGGYRVVASNSNFPLVPNRPKTVNAPSGVSFNESFLAGRCKII